MGGYLGGFIRHPHKEMLENMELWEIEKDVEFD